MLFAYIIFVRYYATVNCLRGNGGISSDSLRSLVSTYPMLSTQEMVIFSNPSPNTLGSAVNLLGHRWMLWFALHLQIAFGSDVTKWMLILPKGSGGSTVMLVIMTGPVGGGGGGASMCCTLACTLSCQSTATTMKSTPSLLVTSLELMRDGLLPAEWVHVQSNSKISFPSLNVLCISRKFN